MLMSEKEAREVNRETAYWAIAIILTIAIFALAVIGSVAAYYVPLAASFFFLYRAAVAERDSYTL